MKPKLKREIRHPGTILLDDWMCPCDISQNALARTMGVSPRRINEIVQGKRAITAETALGLERSLGMSARYWMALQAEWDLAMAVPQHERNLMRAQNWLVKGRPPVANQNASWMMLDDPPVDPRQEPSKAGQPRDLSQLGEDATRGGDRLPRLPYQRPLPSISLEPQAPGTMPLPKERLKRRDRP